MVNPVVVIPSYFGSVSWNFLFSAVSFWKVSPLYMLFIVVFYPSIYVVVSTLPRSLQDSWKWNLKLTSVLFFCFCHHLQMVLLKTDALATRLIPLEMSMSNVISCTPHTSKCYPFSSCMVSSSGVSWHNICTFIFHYYCTFQPHLFHFMCGRYSSSSHALPLW